MLEKTATEASGKRLLYNLFTDVVENPLCVSVEQDTDLDELPKIHPWLTEKNVVVKSDQGIKRRNKCGLVKLDITFGDAKNWIEGKINTQVKAGESTYTLKQFLIEPHITHEPSDEHYVAVYSELEYDVILFHHKGGVDVREVDIEAQRLLVDLNHSIEEEEVVRSLLREIPTSKKQRIAVFIKRLYEMYRDLHFTILELNPFVVKDKIHILDLAARLDYKAKTFCEKKWGEVKWAKMVGREKYPEEKYVESLDVGTPASLKLTILNKKGRIWCGIGGGGTSLLFGDTALKMGCIDELGCYAQFSGPTDSDMLYGFFKTIFDFMLEEKHPKGKVLITGGQGGDMLIMMKYKLRNGPGVFRVLDEYKEKLREHNISIYFRTSVHLVDSKNEGIPLELQKLGISLHVFGGEVPIKDIIEYALGEKIIKGSYCNRPMIYRKVSQIVTAKPIQGNGTHVCPKDELFTSETQVVIVNLWNFAIQGILDYDRLCSRTSPSVTAIVRPESNGETEEAYKWGEGELTIPVYSTIEAALTKHPQISVVFNFAFGLDAYKVASSAIQTLQIRCIIMIVGHLPVRQTRELILLAKKRGVMMIGPTVPKHALQVSVIKPGALRLDILGNIGGPVQDILALNLHRSGSVVFLSRSGGLSLPLCVSIARNTDGLYLGLCLGGGRYTGTCFMDHIAYLHDVPAVKSFVLIGEIGGLEEYDVCDALKSGKITKPVIAFCSGTSVTHFQQEPAFFGHTGGGIDIQKESALAKNEALAEAGAIVPDTFDGIAVKLAEIYDKFAQQERSISSTVNSLPVIPITSST